MSFPKYQENRSATVEWLDDIPRHWKVAPVKAVATCNDEVLADASDPKYEIFYVEISDVEYQRGVVGGTALEFGQAPSRARRRVLDGDVILSTVRTYLRAIANVRRPPSNMIVSTGFCVIRPRSILGRYFGYVAQSEYFVSRVISQSVGVSYPAINASDVMRIAIPIPPAKEQQLVAAFLDRETAKIDALVEEQRRLIELLKEKRQANISHAVTKGLDPNAPMKDSGIEWLGKVPAHWECLRLGNVFREVNEPGTSDLEILSVSIHDGVSDREIGEDERDRKVSRSDDRSKYKRVQPGDLVYNMMRAWQGAFGAVQVLAAVSPAYVVARPQRPTVTRYIELLLRTANAVAEMKRYSKGVTDFRLRLYWDDFKALKIALPPLREQERITEGVSLLSGQSQSLIDAAEAAIVLLQERRLALISAAVTGKIDVRGVVPASSEAA